MKINRVIMLVLYAIGSFSTGAMAVEIDLSKLTPIYLCLTETSGYEHGPRKTGLYVEVQGAMINRNINQFSIQKQSYYDDPISCAVAFSKAIWELDEAWYGKLAATAEERGEDGMPHPDFVPDSVKNHFIVYKNTNADPNVPKVVDRDMVFYFRLGEMHGVFSTITLEFLGRYTPIFFMIPCQEFSKGKYRAVPEWRDPQENIVHAITHSVLVNDRAEEFKERQIHTVDISGLYGDSTGQYPLTLMFADGSPDMYVRINECAAILKPILEQFPTGTDPRPCLQGALREQMKEVFAEASMETMDDNVQNNAFSYIPKINADADFLFDSSEIVLAYYRNAEYISAKFQAFIWEDGKLKRTNHNRRSYLDKALIDECIWLPLSQKLDEIIDSRSDK